MQYDLQKGGSWRMIRRWRGATCEQCGFVKEARGQGRGWKLHSRREV
jgi:hypothetical protein